VPSGLGRGFRAALLLAVLVVAGGRADERPEGVDTVPLQGTMEGYLVTREESGAEQLTELGEVRPGQVIEYRIVYTNLSDRVLRDIAVGGLIPEQTVYLAGSATATRWRQPRFSIDGGRRFQQEPVRYTLRLDNGDEEERIAEPGMYTHVRWVTPRLEPAARIRFRYRVVVRE
jgi:uncharacterized repeat protein (TIGR01451 family)